MVTIRDVELSSMPTEDVIVRVWKMAHDAESCNCGESLRASDGYRRIAKNLPAWGGNRTSLDQNLN
jgi:uncharacterized protein YqiB (DUF1249 family)